MYLNLKSTVSILTLALGLATPNALSMDSTNCKPEGFPSGAAKTSEKMTIKPNEKSIIQPNEFINLSMVKDLYPDSVSVTFYSYAQSKGEKHSISFEKQREVRRILSLDGGGIRGLFSIMELTVLEEIINLPQNKIKDTPYRYIRDLFDIGTGTSTGSILTAGLFSTRNYSATDVAKLYARYGCKIFDKHKRTSPVGIGLTYATYGNDGLKELLFHHFRNDRLQDVHKPIFIMANNETIQDVAIFSTDPLYGDVYELSKTPLVKSILPSCSAPTYFPAVEVSTGAETKQVMSDGGTIANNPAYLVFKKLKGDHNNALPFEIYSFGTGAVPTPETRALDSGALSVGGILNNTLVATEKLVYSNCINELQDSRSLLKYFARINPLLERGMDKLDDTTEAYKEYAIKKAFSVTEGEAFSSMVSQLGLNMPNADELKEIHQTIRNKLDSLKSNKYEKLDKYEKEFVIKKVLDLDIMFYQKRFYQDSKTGEVMQMHNGEAEVFLQNLMLDIEQKKLQGDGFVSNLWSYITTSDDDQIIEFIPRCLEFHQLSDNKITLTNDDFTLLTTQGSQLTQEQLKAISPKHTINGDGQWFSGSTALTTHTNTLVTKLFLGFTECCGQGTKHKYPEYNSHYIHLPALIFWKDTLKDIEGQITKDQLLKLKAHLSENASQIMTSRAYLSTWTAEKAYGSRSKVLVDALDSYIAKFHKD